MQKVAGLQTTYDPYLDPIVYMHVMNMWDYNG
jgi:hypothetical protein